MAAVANINALNDSPQIGLAVTPIFLMVAEASAVRVVMPDFNYGTTTTTTATTVPEWGQHYPLGE